MMPTLVLSADQWQTRRNVHQARVEKLTAAHLQRRTRGERHPVWDFLFDYYPITPGRLSHWSPGFGVALADATPADIAHLKFFHIRSDAEREASGSAFTGGIPSTTAKDEVEQIGTAYLDVAKYRAKRGKTVAYIRELLTKTMHNPAHFDCFGLHEWAMVYRTEHPRHPEPLRLGADGTNEVVDTHSVRCTHFDAYRFFTAAAEPLNAYRPNRAQQACFEQSGCLHANMDVYKWASKLGEIVPGELWLDCFELARDIRMLDMQASPYDLRDWGFEPVTIETPAGKHEYVERQRALSVRANELRRRLVQLADAALG